MARNPVPGQLRPAVRGPASHARRAACPRADDAPAAAVPASGQAGAGRPEAADRRRRAAHDEALCRGPGEDQAVPELARGHSGAAAPQLPCGGLPGRGVRGHAGRPGGADVHHRLRGRGDPHP